LLLGKASNEVDHDEAIWYFLSPPAFKNAKSKQVNRKTEAGYWKPTGKARIIRGNRSSSSSNPDQIGTKKTLVFYKGRVRDGVRTQWIMHEYKSSSTFPKQRDFLLYKLMRKSSSEAGCNDDEELQEHGESGSGMSCNFDNPYGSSNPTANLDNYEVQEELQLQAYLDSFAAYDERSYNLNSAMELAIKLTKLSSSYILTASFF
ncbi:NAC domain-containing protein 69, partial [Linum grandiflorum]